MLRGLGLFTVIVALVGAGCVQPAGIEAASVGDVGATLHNLVSFDATGILPLDPDFANVEMRLSYVGASGPEPTLGVLADGTLFITASNSFQDELVQGPTLARSHNNGATWEIISTGNAATHPKLSLDPWMWVDPQTERIFNAPLYVACTWATWSDDGGETWEGANPVTGCVQGIPAHDHQKLTSGPAPEGIATDGYEGVVYYSYNSFRREGTWIQASFDGGQTYTLGQAVHPASCHSGIAGPVAVGPDGTAYSPKPTCDGIEMATSTDAGATWSLVSVDDVGTMNALAHMTDAAVDNANNAYGTWTGEDGFAYVTRTTDVGQTWSKPIRVSPPGVNSSLHNVITAGEAGQVAVAYLGTRADTSKWKDTHGEAADAEAVWHLFLSVTQDALAESPTWTTIQVTPDDDPVQIGQIWLSGGGEASRNLLDFIDMVRSPDGRLYIGYADGCDKCTKDTDSRRSDAVVAILERGPSLLGGLLEPLEMAMDHGHDEARTRLPITLPVS